LAETHQFRRERLPVFRARDRDKRFALTPALTEETADVSYQAWFVGAIELDPVITSF
jgi:hypothetical protein